MKINVLKEYAALEAMTPKELLVEWKKYYDHPPKNRTNKTYLVNQIIYRIQEMAYGGLTKRTIDRLEALAEGKMVNQRKTDPSRLAIGTRLVREVKGVEHHVMVMDDGYEYQGMKYKSLSGSSGSSHFSQTNKTSSISLMSSAVGRMRIGSGSICKISIGSRMMAGQVLK